MKRTNRTIHGNAKDHQKDYKKFRETVVTKMFTISVELGNKGSMLTHLERSMPDKSMAKSAGATIKIYKLSAVQVR